MNMQQTYSHQPVEWTNETGQRECLRCGRLLTGWGASFRHVDEAVRPMDLEPADAPAVRDMIDLVEQALADMWTERCNDRDRAHVAVAALHRRGLVVTRQKRRRSPSAA